MQGCAGAPLPFTEANQILEPRIQSNVPEPPSNPALYAYLDDDDVPDRVSLEATATFPSFYQVRIELTTGSTHTVPTLLPALVPPPDLSAFLHVYDFDGDGLTDVLVNVEWNATIARRAPRCWGG